MRGIYSRRGRTAWPRLGGATAALVGTLANKALVAPTAAGIVVGLALLALSQRYERQRHMPVVFGFTGAAAITTTTRN